MNKKTGFSRFISFPALLVLCFLFSLPLCAQQNADSEPSLAELFENFKTSRKMPCGQRDETLRVGKVIIDKFSHDTLNKDVIDYVKKLIPKIEAEEKACKDEYSLENLYEKYKAAAKNPCGDRNYAVAYGTKLVEMHGADEKNRAVTESVRKNVERIRQEDRICRREARYTASYKNKRWNEFFTVSHEIINEEGDNPLALDVMLTLTAVGYDLAAYEKDDFYNSDTLYYAKRAIDLIEGGTETGACWGIFECYKSKEKALGWLNYTIGYISYFRQKEDKKAIPFFYKASQYQMEFKYDAFIYQAVAIHYFEKEASMTSSLEINSFITRAQNIVNPIGAGTDNFTDDAAKNNEIVLLYKNLANLYNLRYNLAENENPPDLANYIQMLLNRPLFDPTPKQKRKPPPKPID